MGHEFHADEAVSGLENYPAMYGQDRDRAHHETPEEYRPRTYGEKLIQPVALGNLIMLSQTRNEPNPESQNLGDSIERNGLINQLDVARMPQEALEEYIAFVNRIWGSNHEISHLPVAADGYYYLVIAGHSRTLSIIENETNRAKRALEAGYETSPEEAVVHCKISEAPTPNRIIALQLEENIHHQVAKERQAMCIVETYLYGIETGEWSNQTEFIKEADGRFSAELLRNALHFSRLPESVRDQVMCGALRYSTAVALAKTYPEHVRYCLFEYFEGRSLDELSDEESDRLALFSEQWLGREIAEIQLKKLSATAARKRLDSYRDNWQEVIGRDGDSQPALFMRDPQEEFRVAQNKQKREYRRVLRELAEEPLQQAARALAIHDQLAFGDARKDERDEIDRSTWRFAKALGGTAIGHDLSRKMSA